MPVILHRQDYERWLAVGDPAQLPVDLLRPYPAEEMKAWPVSRDVGNVQMCIRDRLACHPSSACLLASVLECR